MDWEIEIESIMAKNERDRLEAFIDLLNAYDELPPEDWQTVFNQIFTYLGETMPLMEAFVVAFKMGATWEANRERLR